MKDFRNVLLLSTFLFLTVANASARTWRDPMYGGVYSFGEDGVVTVKHPVREFSGKWWSVSPSAVKFQFYDQEGRLRGVNSLEMRTETTAVVHLVDANRSFRWNLIESRGPSEILDSDESGWFMKPLRF
jgi:hypothetical protein